jgi:hypothetical protein
LFVTLALLSGCQTSTPEGPSEKPHRNLAVTPEALPPAATPAGTPSGSPGKPGPTARPGSSAPATAPASPGAPGPTTAAPTRTAEPGGPTYGPFRAVGRADDRRRDAGAATAAYGDITSVTIEDDGTYVRATLWFDGPVPTRLPENEVLGVGVDFFRSTVQLESDYQLYADGQPEGWFAYLHTPKGFVKYPGTFGIGGNRVVFTVPWSSLGSPSSGAFSGFADWTERGPTANTAGEDHAPDLGNATYAR